MQKIFFIVGTAPKKIIKELLGERVWSEAASIAGIAETHRNEKKQLQAVSLEPFLKSFCSFNIKFTYYKNTLVPKLLLETFLSTYLVCFTDILQRNREIRTNITLTIIRSTKLLQIATTKQLLLNCNVLFYLWVVRMKKTRNKLCIGRQIFCLDRSVCFGTNRCHVPWSLLV